MWAYSSGQPHWAKQQSTADANPVAPIGRGEVRKFLDINGAVSCWQPAQDVTEPVVGLGARWSQSYINTQLVGPLQICTEYATPHTTPHHTTLHYTTLHSTTLHYSVHYTALHCTTLH
ncbi:hypothetical protein I7I48_08335 [Histoplasma ohiense]|nr:hypothetical protein I7I48_08335 [Histoplasma ohiense (nom. inval.)]